MLFCRDLKQERSKVLPPDGFEVTMVAWRQVWLQWRNIGFNYFSRHLVCRYPSVEGYIPLAYCHHLFHPDFTRTGLVTQDRTWRLSVLGCHHPSKHVKRGVVSLQCELSIFSADFNESRSSVLREDNLQYWCRHLHNLVSSALVTLRRAVSWKFRSPVFLGSVPWGASSFDMQESGI